MLTGVGVVLDGGDTTDRAAVSDGEEILRFGVLEEGILAGVRRVRTSIRSCGTQSGSPRCRSYGKPMNRSRPRPFVTGTICGALR